MELERLFCSLDDFCSYFEPIFFSKLLPEKLPNSRKSRLSLSEVMTIIVYFHHSGYRTFKDFYQKNILKYHWRDFPNLVSYNRFVELMPHALIPLIFYLNTRKGQWTGISFIDSMGIPICHNKRAKRNKVFSGLASWGRSER